MRLQVGRVDHYDLGLGIHRRQPLYYAREHAPLAPALPPVVQGFVRARGPRRIAPAQPVAVDEHDAAQRPSVTHAMACRGSWERTAEAAPSARPSAKTGRSSRSPRGA